jgi:hypothetical protein
MHPTAPEQLVLPVITCASPERVAHLATATEEARAFGPMAPALRAAVAVAYTLVQCGTIVVSVAAVLVHAWAAVVTVRRLSAWRRTRELVARRAAASSASAYEVGGVAAAAGATCVVSAVAASSADDVVDSAVVGVAALVATTLTLATLALRALAAAAMSPASGAEAQRKLAAADVANTALAAVRVCLCWTRYVFYDAQVECVDMALQYSDELAASTAHAPTSPLAAVADVWLSVVQCALSLGKLAIASFLLWLVVDLFVLRPVARAAAVTRMLRA